MLNLSIDPTILSVDENGVITYIVTPQDITNALTLLNDQLVSLQNTQAEYTSQVNDIGVNIANVQAQIAKISALNQ